MATSPIKKVTNNVYPYYCKMPDGTLITWGYNIIEANQSVYDLSFYVPFINVNYGFSCTPSYGDSNTVILTVSAKGKTGLKVHRQNTSGYSQYFSWLAIGRWK